MEGKCLMKEYQVTMSDDAKADLL
ncbi:type II toxin-antitoxin system mRNA interferase toxin, RelE/StbE family, partial [Streptococcus dysgalactiae]